MLPQKQRIPKALAREVFARGVTTPGPNFFLKILKSPTSETKFAVSISKKIAPTAVLRNRTRRRVYSVLRVFAPQVKKGFLVAFVAKKGGERLNYEPLAVEIENLLKRVGLFSVEKTG